MIFGCAIENPAKTGHYLFCYPAFRFAPYRVVISTAFPDSRLTSAVGQVQSGSFLYYLYQGRDFKSRPAIVATIVTSADIFYPLKADTRIPGRRDIFPSASNWVIFFKVTPALLFVTNQGNLGGARFSARGRVRNGP